MNNSEKRRKTRIWQRILITVVLVLLFLGGRFWGNQQGERYDQARERILETSVFSWESTYMEEENEEALAAALDKLDCSVIFQNFEGVPDQLTKEFLRRRKQSGQAVYALAGAAEYALEKDAGSMIKEIDRIAEINKQLSGGVRIEGLVLDVEPYTLEQWDKDSKDVMITYVMNVKMAYAHAKKQKLVLYLCIPNFYDRTGYEKQLENLIAEGCDGIAIMNYNKADEAGQIETEIRLAQQYEKGVINITELQRPGVWDLTSENTYYEDGMDAVRESWDRLQKAYPDAKLGFSYHYLEPAMEIMSNTGTTK